VAPPPADIAANKGIFGNGVSLEAVLSPLVVTEYKVPANSCTAPVIIQAQGSSPWLSSQPDVTFIYVMDKSGSTFGEGDAVSSLSNKINSFYDSFSDEVLTYPSTKNVGVVTYGTTATIQGGGGLSNVGPTISSWYSNVTDSGKTCCSCGLVKAKELLDSNPARGGHVTIVFLSDGGCNEPDTDPDGAATSAALALTSSTAYSATILKVAVGGMSCSGLNDAIPGYCVEAQDPSDSTDLDLASLVGTKLIRGLITVESDPPIADFPSGISQTTEFTTSDFTSGFKTQVFGWSASLSPGLYDASATIVGQDAPSTAVTSVTDSSSSFFRVVDEFAPTISCPIDMDVTITANNCLEAITYPDPVVTDNCPDAIVTLVQGIASNEQYGAGTTENIFRVVDVGGNTAECSFNINVICEPECFSGVSTVELVDGTSKAMMDVEIGDNVLVGSDKQGQNKYQPVYGFGHKDHEHESSFLQLYFDSNHEPLELSSTHLIYRQGEHEQTPLPASLVQVGDVMQGKHNSPMVVTKIDSVTRPGLYAPFTQDGTIVVNGVVASNFVTFQPNEAYVVIGGINTGWSYHALSVYWNKPYEFYCTTISRNQCRDQIYMEGGISAWSYLGRSMASFMFQNNTNAWVQTLIFVTVLPLMLIAVALISILEYAGSWWMTMMVGGLLSFVFVTHSRKNKTDKNIHNIKLM